MKNIYKNFLADIIIAVLLLSLGVLLLPCFDIGKTILDIIVAILLCIYLLLYLAKRFHGTRTYVALTAVEFTVIALIAIGLFLKQFNIINIGNTCQILGVVIWLRGVCSLVNGYFLSSEEKKKNYSLLLFFGYISIITLGAYLFAKPLITDVALIWIFCIGAFALAAFFTILAIRYRPAGKKRAVAKKTNTKK